jgi:hypothetical protein
MAICSALPHRTASGSRVRDERVTGWEAGGRLPRVGNTKCRFVGCFVRERTGLEPTRPPGVEMPSRARRRSATNASKQAYLQEFFDSTPNRLRMVEPNRPIGCLGHEWAAKSCLHRKRPERFGLQRGPRSEGSAPPLSGACRPAGRSREDGRPGATPLASASGTGPATWPPTARGTRSGSARVLRRPRLALIGRAHGAPEPAQPLVPRHPRGGGHDRVQYVIRSSTRALPWMPSARGRARKPAPVWQSP